jgi:hypothetical protein
MLRQILHRKSLSWGMVSASPAGLTLGPETFTFDS